MSHQLVYCTVRESKHRAIYVVRVQDAILEPFELENIAELMRDKLAARGELMAEVVTMQAPAERRCACRAILIRCRWCAPLCSMRRSAGLPSILRVRRAARVAMDADRLSRRITALVVARDGRSAKTPAPMSERPATRPRSRPRQREE